MYTKHYISEIYIYGPRGYTQYYFDDKREYIYGPNGYTHYYRSDEYFYGPNGYTQFYLSDEYIYGPRETLPWME